MKNTHKALNMNINRNQNSKTHLHISQLFAIIQVQFFNMIAILCKGSKINTQKIKIVLILIAYIDKKKEYKLSLDSNRIKLKIYLYSKTLYNQCTFCIII